MTFNRRFYTTSDAAADLSHDADIDFSVWLGTDFRDSQLDHVATIEGFLRAAYRAGWDARREEEPWTE